MERSEHFLRSEERQKAFDGIKDELLLPPTLFAPVHNRLLILYITHIESGVAALLAQSYDGRERLVYYLSTGVNGVNAAEKNYSKVEKACLALVFVAQKVRHYFSTHHEVYLVIHINLVRFLLQQFGLTLVIELKVKHLFV